MFREDGAVAPTCEMPIVFTQELKDLWTTALRSGNFDQYWGQLYSPNAGYCCLGVLAHVAGWGVSNNGLGVVIGGESMAYGPFETMFGSDTASKLYNMNDTNFVKGTNKTFPEIADFIDANIEAVV